MTERYPAIEKAAKLATHLGEVDPYAFVEILRDLGYTVNRIPKS